MIRFVALVLLLLAVAPAAKAQDRDLYFLAIGSSKYAEAESPGDVALPRIRGANTSARAVGERLSRASARFGVVLTADEGLVSLNDIDAGLDRVTGQITADKSAKPFLVFYFAGHGLSEGVGWNHFSIPGGVVLPGTSPVSMDYLQPRALHAATLVDRLDKLGLPYLVILDTCYEGEARQFEAGVLTDTAAEGLNGVIAALRVLNEFHQDNPVLMSAKPGTKVRTVENPSDPGDDPVAPLARRFMILADRAWARHGALSLADVVSSLSARDFDAATGPAATHATFAAAWADTLLAGQGAEGVVETRSGTATGVSPPRALTAYAASAEHGMKGAITLHSSPGEFIGDGQQIVVATPARRITAMAGSSVALTADPGGANWSISLEAADGQPLKVGAYKAAQRASVQDPGHPGLSVSGDGRGCNEVSGEYTISDLSVGPDGALRRLAATFRQYCDGITAPLDGSIDIRAGK